MAWKRVIEHPVREEAVSYAQKLRKQGYKVRIRHTRNGYAVESTDLYRNPVQRMLG